MNYIGFKFQSSPSPTTAVNLVNTTFSYPASHRTRTSWTDGTQASILKGGPQSLIRWYCRILGLLLRRVKNVEPMGRWCTDSIFPSVLPVWNVWASEKTRNSSSPLFVRFFGYGLHLLPLTASKLFGSQPEAKHHLWNQVPFQSEGPVTSLKTWGALC